MMHGVVFGLFLLLADVLLASFLSLLLVELLHLFLAT